MTEPALAHWLDQHRAYLAKLVYHLVYSLHVLPDHDEHALHAVLAESAAVRKAAAEVTQHLAHTELVGTPLADHYAYLAGSIDMWWPEAYRKGGAQALRDQLIGQLESTMRELEHPAVPVKHRSHDPYGRQQWEWIQAANEQSLALLHRFRDALATVRHDPHCPDHLTAARQALTALTDAVHGTVQHLDQLATERMRPNYLLERWVEEAQRTYQLVGDYLAHPPVLGALDHTSGHDLAAAIPHVEETTWLATEVLNQMVARLLRD